MTSVVKLLDITLLGHTVIDLKVDFNMFADETVGVALKLETPQHWTRWIISRTTYTDELAFDHLYSQYDQGWSHFISEVAARGPCSYQVTDH